MHWDALGLVSVLFDIVINALEEAENGEIFMITNDILGSIRQSNALQPNKTEQRDCKLADEFLYKKYI